jgi:hypothetical protein
VAFGGHDWNWWIRVVGWDVVEALTVEVRVLVCTVCIMLFCKMYVMRYLADYSCGTTWTSHSAPYCPLTFSRLSASPSGPALLVALLASTPFFSPDWRYSRNRTEVSMYSRNAILGSREVPVTIFMIQGTMRGASVQDGWAVPAVFLLVIGCVYYVGLDLLSVMNHPSLTLSMILLTTSKCLPWS